MSVALSLSWWYPLKCKFAFDEVQLFPLFLFFFFAISILETDYGETLGIKYVNFSKVFLVIHVQGILHVWN